MAIVLLVFGITFRERARRQEKCQGVSPHHPLTYYFSTIFTHGGNRLNHDLCSIVFFFPHYSIRLHWRGSSPGSSGAQKLVAAAALIEIESLPFVEKVLTVFFSKIVNKYV
jgi:hypothetical protein